MDGSSEDDPLIAPCQCRGSIKHVHLQCLRKWVGQRLHLDTDGGTRGCNESHFYPHTVCDLCKTDYASNVQYKDTEVPLIEGPSFTKPTVVLEDASSHGFYVICLKDGKVGTLGRSHACDAVMADVSISRVHATLRFHEGKFLIQDNGSKFGTRIAMKRKKLSLGESISVQVGHTVLAISMGGAQRSVLSSGELGFQNLEACQSFDAESCTPDCA